FVCTCVIAPLLEKLTVERRCGWRPLLIIAVATLAYGAARNPQLLGARRLWTPSPPREWLAAAVVLLGLSVTLWARLALGRNWSASVTFKQDHELIERGPYRHVRHPIYTGILLMALGTAMLHAWVSAFVLCGIVLVGFWFK